MRGQRQKSITQQLSVFMYFFVKKLTVRLLIVVRIFVDRGLLRVHSIFTDSASVRASRKYFPFRELQSSLFCSVFLIPSPAAKLYFGQADKPAYRFCCRQQ